jgi:hypothetical protein
MSLVYRVLRNILQFNLVYLSHNANPLPNLKFTKVANLGYYRIDLLLGLVFYLNKYPVIGRK